MAQQPFEQEKQPNILTQIHEGMTVCDDKGDKIGTVRQVYLGAVTEDQDKRGLGAATPSPPGQEETSLIEDVAKVFAANDPLPEPLRQHLLRHGFIRINTSGIFTADRYATSEHIEGITDDRVSLRVSRDALIKR